MFDGTIRSSIIVPKIFNGSVSIFCSSPPINGIMLSMMSKLETPGCRHQTTLHRHNRNFSTPKWSTRGLSANEFDGQFGFVIIIPPFGKVAISQDRMIEFTSGKWNRFIHAMILNWNDNITSFRKRVSMSPPHPNLIQKNNTTRKIWFAGDTHLTDIAQFRWLKLMRRSRYFFQKNVRCSRVVMSNHGWRKEVR